MTLINSLAILFFQEITVIPFIILLFFWNFTMFWIFDSELSVEHPKTIYLKILISFSSIFMPLTLFFIINARIEELQIPLIHLQVFVLLYFMLVLLPQIISFYYIREKYSKKEKELPMVFIAWKFIPELSSYDVFILYKQLK